MFIYYTTDPQFAVRNSFFRSPIREILKRAARMTCSGRIGGYHGASSRCKKKLPPKWSQDKTELWLNFGPNYTGKNWTATPKTNGVPMTKYDTNARLKTIDRPRKPHSTKISNYAKHSIHNTIVSLNNIALSNTDR